MAVRNVKKPLAIIMALLMAFTAVAVLASEDSSEAVNYKTITDDGFKEDHKGTLKINYENAAFETVQIIIKDGDKVVYQEDNYDLGEGSNSIKCTFELDKGDRTLDIFIGSFSTQYEIDVKENVWSNVITYVAIVLIAIIVVIIAVVYMRQNPRNKPTTTFTQLEKEKQETAKVEAASKAEKATTEKIKYTSSRRK